MSEMKSFIESQLKDMGFTESQISKALSATKAESLDQVMDWILTHSDTDGEEQSAAPAGETAADPDAGPAAESVPVPEPEPVKPKTAEELEAEKKKLEEKIKERRKQREEEERQAEIEREKSRRQTGNAIVQLREKVEMEERVRLAEQRKQEKKDDAIHKQKILDQIKRDREAQRNKAAGTVSVEPMKPVAPAPQPKTFSDNCRLAISLPDGSKLMQDFNSREQLAAVKLYVQLNRKDLSPDDPAVSDFTFRFPPATLFSTEDMERPLVDLGLCPSSRLVVVKK